MARVKRIYVLQGLPGSGKSTKAAEILKMNKNAMRVNKDDLRAMLHFSEYNAALEKTVIALEYDMVAAILDANKDVIVDDTNFNPEHIMFYQSIATAKNAIFELIEMPNDVEECIKRDAKRGKTYKPGRNVGSDVIRNMAYKHGILEQLRPIAIFDLDGTLSDPTHRRELVHSPAITAKTVKPDWDGFFKLAYLDAPRTDIINKAIEHKEMGYEIVIVSACPEDWRDMRTKWLKHYNVPFDRFIMRPSGNYEKDFILKEKLLNNYINRDMVEIIYDDRPSVIRMWRSKGIEVVDCGNGEEF